MIDRHTGTGDVTCVLHYVTTMTLYGRVTSSVTWPFDAA